MSYNNLNKLELAILAKFFSANFPASGVFEENIKDALVTDRENTGSGIFISINLNKLGRKFPDGIYSGVFANIDGMKNPIAFVLFINDGLILQLEGASIDESTTGIDLSNAAFKVL